ncbi:efflux transporter outer membrane subunit [Desulfovibrio sp. OttesenSCG-928-A18]|nr:efflux transporter outer membrane subunit [Desulfovibrio sp. OttesenSCG-928-A18]
MKYAVLLLSLLACLTLTGCFNLSPGYIDPGLHTPMAVEYKEDQGWTSARALAALDRGTWWEIFEDPSLNALVAKANSANQNIAVAAANLRQARAQIVVARSALFPGVSLPASLSRSGGENRGPGSNWSYGLSAQWEISFWNALPALESAKAMAQASAADLAAMRLAVQAELAQAYFQLRALDSQRSLYDSTIKAYREAVRLTNSQFRGGMVTRADVAQAEAQLAQAEAQLAAVERQRAQTEHAVAILTGQMPSSFSLERADLQARVPQIPTAIPGTLLERRPDIAAAERRVAAANQQIGLARAAWFPSLSLGASILEEGTAWLGASLYSWSVGPSAALELFQGGRRLAESDAARAAYDADVAAYRQAVLEAVKDVEDNLAALRLLEKEAEAQDRAVRASREALRLSMSQYRGGMVTYLQVVNNQATVLSNERNAIDITGQKLNAAVGLVKALGGGWQKNDIEAMLR